MGPLYELENPSSIEVSWPRTEEFLAVRLPAAAEDPAEAHSYWRQERDRMFATHPASALT